jgi:hypothetical protein
MGLFIIKVTRTSNSTNFLSKSLSYGSWFSSFDGSTPMRMCCFNDFLYVLPLSEKMGFNTANTQNNFTTALLLAMGVM